MDFLGCRDDFSEVPDNSIALSLRDTNDLRYEARVEEERIPSGDWMGTDERVFGRDWITTNRPAKSACVVCLHVCRV